MAALARCRDGDPQRAIEAIRVAERPHLHLFIATSDIHLKHKLRIDREEALARRRASGSRYGRKRARAATPRSSSAPRTPRRTDPTSCCRSTRRSSRPARRPSTSPTPSATRSRPSSRRSSGGSSSASAARRRSRVHCHNDLGLATANTLAAVQAGARQVEVTINGLGERAGNASLEEVVMALRTRPDASSTAQLGEPASRPSSITAASRLVSYLTGFAVQPNKAIVGGNAFAHESGIHQDGVIKNPLTYEIMTPQSVGLDGLDDLDRQAVRPARPPGQARRARLRARGRGARRDLPRRRSRSPTRRRRSPTTTSSRSSSSAWPRSRQAVAARGLERDLVATAARRPAGSRSSSATRTPPRRRSATGRSTRCSRRSTRRSSRSSAGSPSSTEYEIRAVSGGEDAQGRVLVRCRRSSGRGARRARRRRATG